MVDRTLSPLSLARQWTPPEDALPAIGNGRAMQAVRDHFSDSLDSLGQAVAAPKDAMDGKFDPSSIEGVHRAMGTAGLAMTGGLAGGPEGAIGSGPMRPIRAYHGSPHDFEKFDISKIGTGEGAQAYGHGLYFAENEGVAKSYRDQLSGMDRSIVPADSWGDMGKVRAAAATHFKDSPEDQSALTLLANYFANGAGKDEAIASSTPHAKMFKTTPEAIERVANQVHSPGRMYEVNLHADPERLLDWDKPLGAQPAIVDRFNSVARLTQSERERLPIRSILEMVGTPSESSKRLLDAGIPGVRYLDGGSRAAGDGSRNYVMFDHQPVEIIRKYAAGGRVEDLDIPSNRAMMIDDPELVDILMNRQSARQQGQIPPLDWAGDLRGVHFPPQMPTQRRKYDDGGYVEDDSAPQTPQMTEDQLRQALQYLAMMQKLGQGAQ